MAKAAKSDRLLDMLDKAVAPQRSTPAPARAETPPPVGRYFAPSRQGKTLVSAHLPAEYGRTLKLLAAETGKSQQELLEQALKALFTAQRIDMR